MRALERMTVLDQHVDMMRIRGYVMTEQVDPFTVDIRELRTPATGPNHVRHLLLTFFSLGIGGVLWLIVIRDHLRVRRRLDRDPFFAGTWRLHVAESGEIETYQIG